MSKRYSGKSFKDSSVMKKPKLTFKEKRKLKEEKKKKRWKVVPDYVQIAPTSAPKNLWYNWNIMNVFIILSILMIVIGVLVISVITVWSNSFQHSKKFFSYFFS